MKTIGEHTSQSGLQDNIDSGYAVFITWQQIAQSGPHIVREKVALANSKSKSLIKNDRPRMLKDGVPPWKRTPDTSLRYMILNPEIDPWCQYSIFLKTASMSLVIERLPLPVSIIEIAVGVIEYVKSACVTG